MKIASIFIVMYVFGLFACSSNKDRRHDAPFEETLITYVNAKDSSIEFDSTDLNYRFLKSYLLHDTSKLQEAKNEIAFLRNERTFYHLMDTCLHIKNLSEMEIEEGYRFIYTAPFCPYTIIVTIEKRKDSVNLSFLLYQYAFDKAPCKIVSKYNKQLSLDNWSEFMISMDNSDFWGLKSQNGRQGVDGSTLRTIGYQVGYPYYNRPTKYHYVYRWGPNTLRDPLNYLLLLSENTQGCYSIRRK